MAWARQYSGHISKGGKSSVYITQNKGTHFIIIFKSISGKLATYRIDRSAVGEAMYKTIDIMAIQGKGLNAYIHKHVKWHCYKV